ncbi:hypothetical protein DSO57_1002690 [Entomophthora muscae]|uniref:Uncharacterized protein n=1 Tax=Entomophthora muscae TaxID=34485 RepID=A0ACC2UIB4_9FUNG|nr:hypothetical protein DSO57_1002690 [Entomophthora muscae]
MGAWQPWDFAVNYMLRISPVMYWAFQACPLSLFANKPDTTPGYDTAFILSLMDPTCATAVAGMSCETVIVVNATIQNVFISLLMGYFEDKTLSFAFAP